MLAFVATRAAYRLFATPEQVEQCGALRGGARRTTRHSFPLERSLVNAIRDRGESPFVVFSAAVALYLAKVHQVDEVVLGVPVLNRSGGPAKQTVGQFANTLPMRVATGAGLTVDEVLSRVRQDTRALLKHQRMPLGGLGRGPTRHHRGLPGCRGARFPRRLGIVTSPNAALPYRCGPSDMRS